MFVLFAGTRYRSRFDAFSAALKPRTRALFDNSPLSNGSSIRPMSAPDEPGTAITVYSWPFATSGKVPLASAVVVPVGAYATDVCPVLMFAKFVTFLYEMFFCNAPPLTRKSTAGPLGIACTKWINGFCNPSSLPTSFELPPHADTSAAAPMSAAMVLITFICHLSLIGLEPVDLRLAACAVASVLRRRYVSLSAARPRLCVQHGDAPFICPRGRPAL